MSKSKWIFVLLGTVLVVAGVWTTPAAQTGRGPGVIQGTVKSADGSAMEGVIVSARAADKSFTTSVFTDRQGNYVFPSLDAGQYRVWAQAVGFEAGRSEFALAGARVERNFTLAPNKQVAQTIKQMSGVEYLQSLPQTTAADRRMVHAYKNNCTGCHTASYTLQNRWDSNGWGMLVDLMTVFPSSGVPVPGLRPTAERPGNRMIAAYRDELAEYLGRARGATELSNLKLLPRASGEATQVVITEFDLPRTDRPLHFDNGSDWSMGTPSRFVGRAAHDVWVDADGIIWMADDMVPERTFAKLDPRTGRVTDYALKGEDGKSISTHSVVVDHTAKVWATGDDGNFAMLDSKTGQMKSFPRPSGMRPAVGGTLDVDSKGNPWATSTNGAIKLDVTTGQYTHYEGPPAPEGFCGSECGGWGTYGVAIDRTDNAWVTNPGLDRLLKVDSRTGQVTAGEHGPAGDAGGHRGRPAAAADRAWRSEQRAAGTEGAASSRRRPERGPDLGRDVHERPVGPDQHQEQRGEGVPASDAVQLALCDGRGQERQRLDQHDESRRADEVRSEDGAVHRIPPAHARHRDSPRAGGQPDEPADRLGAV